MAPECEHGILIGSWCDRCREKARTEELLDAMRQAREGERTRVLDAVKGLIVGCMSRENASELCRRIDQLVVTDLRCLKCKEPLALYPFKGQHHDRCHVRGEVVARDALPPELRDLLPEKKTP